MKNYVDKDKLQEYTTKLHAKNKTIFATKNEVGSPLVASTVAEMTDTNKVYVYVGSESGYTSGNWYYYDGSAWVSGGVYNSTAFVTDATLTQAGMAADAKAVGDEVSSLKGAFEGSAGEAVAWETGTQNYGQKWDSGALTGNALVDTTKYIDVSKYKYIRYVAFCSSSSSTLLGIAFFTGKTQGTYISGVQGYSGITGGTMREQWAEVPNGAIYARFTVRKDFEGFFIEGYANLPNQIKNVKDYVDEEISASKEELKSLIFGIENGESIIETLDGGTWEQGEVSVSGIDTTVLTQAHSEPISIGEYDYINIELTSTDTSYWFTVYKYDGESYSQTELRNVWIKRGGASFEDKNAQYIVCVKASDNTTIDAETAKAAVKITVQNNFLDITDSLMNAAHDENIELEMSVSYGALSVTTGSGYANSRANASTMPLSIADFDGIHFSLIDPVYSYAVYSYDGTTFTNVSGGYTTADTEYTDKSVRYIIRVHRADSASIEENTFVDACKAVSIKRVAFGTNNETYGYERCYTDITRTLMFERKAISAEGITDSTVSLLAKLPNDGNFECRLNRPAGKFAVWKVSGETRTCLTGDWTYYQYRYTGDYTSDYYIAVAYPEDTTIPLTSYNIAGVYQYLDTGVQRNILTSLSGKNIAVFGDSIVQGRMCKNGHSVNMVMPKPYSNLISEIAGTEPNNFGIGGALVYDNDWKSLSRHYNSVTGFDVVFICAGTNDYGGGIALTDFESAFTTILTALVANNTKVVVCTPTRRSTNGTNSTTGLTMQDYASAEISIAESMNVDVIDLYTLTNTAAFKAHLTDGLHPNEIGSKMIADIILEQMG